MKKLFLSFILLFLFPLSIWAQCPSTCTEENTFLGIGAGLSNTTGSSNSFFGSQAGFSNTTGNANSFYGKLAGIGNTTGSSNSFFGSQAGKDNTTGSSNSFFGNQAGFSNTTGIANSFYGGLAGIGNTTGSANSFFGHQAGVNSKTGSSNSFFGNLTGFNNMSGSSNSFFGGIAGAFNTSGSRNTFVGYEAGLGNEAGSDNVFLGYQAGAKEQGSNKLYIANDTTSTPLIYGDFAQRKLAINGFLGLGIQNPERPIHLRDEKAIFRIDRDRPDPGFAIVRYSGGFQDVMKSFYFYTLGTGANQGKFIIADWGREVSGPNHKARLTIDNEGDIGIGPLFEDLSADATAKLHVDGTVRFQNLPGGLGQPLVIDAQGNVRVDSSHISAKSMDFQELKNKIQSQDQEIAILKAEIMALKSSLNADNASDQALLYQNKPNPFDKSSVIAYQLPENVSRASIVITDLQGKKIKEEILSQKGSGKLTIQANSLSSGIYLYSLVVNGQLLDTKRMMID